MADCYLSDRVFDGVADARNVVGFAFWMDNQVRVLWHEHVGPEVELVFILRGSDGVSKPLAGAFGSEEFESVEAREGEDVRVACDVEVATSWASGAGHGKQYSEVARSERCVVLGTLIGMERSGGSPAARPQPPLFTTSHACSSSWLR